MSERAASMRAYLGFVALAAGLALALGALGYWPTRALGGEGAVEAMWVACAVSLMASVVSGLPLALAGSSSPVVAVLLPLGLRFGLAVLISAAALLRGRLPATAFLLWVAISYGVLLVADTRYALSTDAVSA